MVSNGRSFGLDLIRALAVSLVLIAHFAKQFELFGFWGVELFFGLSGFLIGQILWKGFSETKEWTFFHIINFWSRRWWRTLPNYYLFLIVALIFHHFNGDGLPSFSTISNFLWFGQNLFSRYGGFYGVSWSLCIEELFYLTFPLILFIFHKLKIKHHLSFILTLLTFFIGSALIREFLVLNGQENFLRTITFSRLDSIAYGVAAAYILMVKKIDLTLKRIFFSLGIIFLLAPVFTVIIFDSTFDELRQSRLLLIIVPLGASLILPLTSLLKAPNGMYAFFKVTVEKLSHWSYSIYLSHIPIMFFTYYIMDNIRDSFMGNLISKTIGLILTITLSALIFRFFEVPFTRKRPQELKSLN